MAIYYICTKIFITRSLIDSDRQISIKTYDIIFHKNPTWSRVPCGLLATYDIANSRFPQFCEWAGRIEHGRYCTLQTFLFFYFFLDFYSCSVMGRPDRLNRPVPSNGTHFLSLGKKKMNMEHGGNDY